MLNPLPSYFSIPIVFIAWLLSLWLVKRILLRHLRNWVKRTPFSWGDLIIESVSFPINFLIFISGLVFLLNLMPLPDKFEKISALAFQGSVVFACVVFLDSFARHLINRNISKGVLGNVSHGVAKGLVRGFIIGLGVLIFLDLMGISITPILASLGIGSLAVALALQDTLSNFFAGIYVAVDKPVEEGQFVKLENGNEGYVTDIGWRSTRIRTLSNNTIVIPNSKLMGSIITNYYLPDREVAFGVEMEVHYDSDLNRVQNIVEEVARGIAEKAPGCVADSKPGMAYSAFGESGVRFSVNFRAKEFTDTFLIKHAFIKTIHERFRKEGILIPYPTRTVRLLPENKLSS